MTTSTTLHIHRAPAAGVASGPSVVLLHGFTSSGDVDFPAEQWAAPFAAAGRETLIVDLPGHGASPALPAGGFTTTQAIAALDAAVASAATAEVDLIGYSLGARLAWDLASTSPVRRLVLGGLSPQEPFSALDAEAAQAFFDGGPAPQDPLTAMMSQMMADSGQDTVSLLSLVTGMGREPFEPAAQPPQQPTLLLAGADDAMTTGLEEVAGLLPRGRYEQIPGDHAGALASVDFPERAMGFLSNDQ